jgi:hypothetical protein
LTFDRPFGPIGTEGLFRGPGAAIGAPGLVAAPAFAQPEQGNLAFTIYNENPALVQDTRQLDLPAGRSRQEIPQRLRPRRRGAVPGARARTAMRHRARGLSLSKSLV